MAAKNCPFCEQLFNIETLKGHIVSVHLGLEKLAGFWNIQSSTNETETIEPDESIQIKVELSDTTTNENHVNDFEEESNNTGTTNESNAMKIKSGRTKVIGKERESSAKNMAGTSSEEELTNEDKQNKKPSNYQCNLCNVNFALEEILDKHVYFVHTEEKETQKFNLTNKKIAVFACDKTSRFKTHQLKHPSTLHKSKNKCN